MSVVGNLASLGSHNGQLVGHVRQRPVIPVHRELESLWADVLTELQSLPPCTA